MGETEPPSTLPTLLASVVRARGSHPAVVMTHETVSYDELDRRTAAMARALLATGAGKGARIGLLAPDGIAWVIAFLAGLWIAGRQAKKAGLDANRITDMAVYVLIAGLVGAKLLLLVVEWSYFSKNPRELLSIFQSGGVFYGGLSRTRARTYMEPVFGCYRPGVEAAIAAANPADLLFTTGLRPGELALYANYPARDNWNFDAQTESFAWLASTRGVAVDLERVPRARHDLRYFRSQHPRAFRWLAAHLLPPTDPLPPPGP